MIGLNMFAVEGSVPTTDITAFEIKELSHLSKSFVHWKYAKYEHFEIADYDDYWATCNMVALLYHITLESCEIVLSTQNYSYGKKSLERLLDILESRFGIKANHCPVDVVVAYDEKYHNFKGYEEVLDLTTKILKILTHQVWLSRKVYNEWLLDYIWEVVNKMSAFGSYLFEKHSVELDEFESADLLISLEIIRRRDLVAQAPAIIIVGIF